MKIYQLITIFLFLEFAWKKVGITAVFLVIAIIIGVCLGLLIKGCDKSKYKSPVYVKTLIYCMYCKS